MQSLIQQQADQISTESKTVQQLRDAAEQGSIQNDQLIEHVAKLQQQIKEGLIDTAGSGANANIIRLTKELRDTIKSGLRDDSRASKQKAAAPSTSTPSTNPSEIEERTRESAGQYNRTNKDALRELKETFTLEGFFDFSPGKKRGLFGNVLANKVSRDQYVKDQIETNPDMLNQFGGDKKKAKKHLAEEFNKQQKIRGEQKQVQERIDTLKSRGYSEDEIKRTGLYAKRETLDDNLAVVDKRYSNQRDQTKSETSAPIRSQSTPPAADQGASAPIRRGVGDNVIAFPARGNATPTTTMSGATEEIEQENLRMMEEQNDLLKKIEENTRALGAAPKDKPEPTPATPAAGGSGGGIGGLGGLGRVAGRGLKAAGSLLKRAGPGLMRAGATAARFAGPAAAVAAAGYTGYKAGQWLNENTNIQQNIASGIEKVKGVFGASEEDKMKEVEQNSAQASYDKRVAGGGKINQGLANMYKSQGVEVDESLIVSNEEWGKLDPATGKPKTETTPAAATPAATTPAPSNTLPGWEMGPNAKSYKELPLEEAAVKGSSFEEVTPVPPPATPATPVAPAPVAGPKAAAAGEVPPGAIPIRVNNELVGYMDPTTEKITPIKGMEDRVEHIENRKISVQRQLARSASTIARTAPQGADNLVQQTNETKMAQEEKDAKQASKPPVVISAPSQTTIQQTSNTSVRNPARNTESSIAQYNMGRFKYV